MITQENIKVSHGVMGADIGLLNTYLHKTGMPFPLYVLHEGNHKVEPGAYDHTCQRVGPGTSVAVSIIEYD
jgi:hypothetical protein